MGSNAVSESIEHTFFFFFYQGLAIMYERDFQESKTEVGISNNPKSRRYPRRVLILSLFMLHRVKRD